MKRPDQKNQTPPARTSHFPTSEASYAHGEDDPDYEQVFMRLLHLGQRLCGQTEGVAEQLCQGVTQATQGQAWLSLAGQETAKKTRQQPPPGKSTGFPVQFRDLTYGTLYVRNDPAHPGQPVIPPARAYLLAQICGYILYALEASALLQFQYQHLESQAPEPLTRRQREVLDLLCRGYDQKAIAELLHISTGTLTSHRQHIYEKLHVHNERDLVLAAFRAGLFSPLEGVSGMRHHI